MLVVVLAGLLGACAAPGASPAPTPASTPTPTPGGQPTPSPLPSSSPSPSPAPVGEVSSAAQAAALVFASDERYARMSPLRSDMVGQSAWYEAYADSDGFTVAITIGSGDCQAGCIDRHTWTYHVDTDGTITLVADEGDPVEYSPPAGNGAPVTLRVILNAGPVCPVEQTPPDPACAPRAVANAEVIVRATDGSTVATGLSNAEGVVIFEIPEGAYFVEAAPVEGLMGTPDAQAFSAVGGDGVGLLMGYDTGIR